MQSIPVQNWTFEHEPIIRIGRSTDNHVILYSAVVSRHHVEIRKVDAGWEIVNLGANGTYLDGKRITQVSVEDGVIIRLARSGPNVQIHLGSLNATAAGSLVGEATVGQNAKLPKPAAIAPANAAQTDPAPADLAPANVTPANAAQTDISESEVEATADAAPAELNSGTASLNRINSAGINSDGIDSDIAIAVASPNSEQADSGNLLSETASPRKVPPTALNAVSISVDDAQADRFALSECCYQHIESEHLFCLNCGKPLRPLGTAEKYQIVKILSQDEFSLTQLAWKNGRSFVLKTLLPAWMGQPEAIELFHREATQFLQISHPALPKFVEVFVWMGQPYLVMQPVYGRSLEQVITTAGTLTPPQAIALILKVCDALDYLHTQIPPILHQSLQPEHLIQQTAAVPKLVVSGLTPGRIMVPQTASNGFAAPEQQQGQASPASDLYALAPILAYLLTGKSAKTFYAQREQGFRFYAEYVPGITSNLIEILRKLTAPQPEERFASAKQVAEALQSIAIT